MTDEASPPQRGAELASQAGLRASHGDRDRVVELLRDEYRCVVPTLPMGSHRLPMKHDADLSLRGMGRIVAEFLDRAPPRGVVRGWTGRSCR